ncbi:unnamed protein product, partial [Effrenium voratum]
LYDCMRGQFVLLSNHILPQSLLEFGPAIQALGVRTSLEAMEHVKDNSQCILERLRDRVRRENIGHCDPLQEGQKLQLEGQDNVVVKVTKVNQWKDLKSFQDKEEKHKYHGMCKNCKHLAYD